MAPGRPPRPQPGAGSAGAPAASHPEGAAAPARFQRGSVTYCAPRGSREREDSSARPGTTAPSEHRGTGEGGGTGACQQYRDRGTRSSLWHRNSSSLGLWGGWGKGEGRPKDLRDAFRLFLLCPSDNCLGLRVVVSGGCAKADFVSTSLEIPHRNNSLVCPTFELSAL